MKDYDDAYFRDPLVKAANDVYSLFFIGWLLGFATFFIGFVMALFHRRKAVGFTHSHFVFQLTMAWQGYIVLALLVLLCMAIHYALPHHGWLMKLVAIGGTVVFVRWWLQRTFAGYRLLSAHVAVRNPYVWGKPDAALEGRI